MDGDAWGSLGWLYLVLKWLGKEVICINDGKVPDGLNFLGYSDIITPEIDVESFDPDICISLDAAGADRLWESYTKWKHVFDQKPFIVIDHHISNTGFGDINIIDVKASSVCELLTNMLVHENIECYISPEAATFFYTGIQTDTNMYATSNTTKKTLQAGAKLIELWADFRLPIQKCFREKTPEQIDAWKLAYANTTLTDNKNISYCVISQEDAKEFGIPLEKLSEYLKGFINETLINIQWVKVAFLLYPLINGETKWSMRSVDTYDVNTICQKFWGGGHTQAAGFQKQEDIHKIKQQLLKESQKIL